MILSHILKAIDDWHNNVKKVSLKKRSWDREYHTKENQIKKYPIAHMQMQAIKSEILAMKLMFYFT